MVHYLTTIKFRGKKKGKRKGARYPYAAGVYDGSPQIVYIYKHPFWKEMITKGWYTHLSGILSHETIHHILWKMGCDDKTSGFDVIREKFVKALPLNIESWYLKI